MESKGEQLAGKWQERKLLLNKVMLNGICILLLLLLNIMKHTNRGVIICRDVINKQIQFRLIKPGIYAVLSSRTILLQPTS